GVIEPKLRQAEIERSKRKPTESLDAYDCFLRAFPQCRLSLTDNLKALELLNQAIKIDPFYSPAIALTAYCYAIQKFEGWAVLSDTQIAEGVRLAKHAIRLGQDASEALWMAGYALSWLAGEHDAAVAAIDRALVLTPNSANAWNVKGWVHLYMGQ